MEAAVVGLVRGHKDIRDYADLIRRNHLIQKNVDRNNKYDKIIFTEGDIKKSHKKYIERNIEGVEFKDVSKNSFIQEEELKQSQKNNIGYKNMCRFNSIEIWKYVEEYDYIMRLDDDSFVMNKKIISSLEGGDVYEDIFDFMKEENMLFTYVRDKIDGHQKTKSTLPNKVKSFVRNKKIKKKCSEKDISNRNFYNNIYATKVSFWMREEVQSLLKYLDKSMGIYNNRWGDSTIIALALKLFCDRDKIVKMDRIKYKHGSHGWSNYEENDKIESLKKRYWKYRARILKYIHI